MPTAPEHPTIAEVAADPIGVNSRMGTYTNFCNLFDLCAVAVPAGTVEEGERGVAQFGVTLLARAFGTRWLADVARRFLGAATAVPSWAESAGAPSCELAVFGAHLRGQPLENELSGRGARWAGPVATAPRYRLKALDTAPPKPGLLRLRGRGGVDRGGALGALTCRTRGVPRGAPGADDARRGGTRRRHLDHRLRLRSRRRSQGRDITVHGSWVAALV